MTYGYKKEVSLTFDETLEKAKSELAKEGFGILTEINVKETLKKKLDKDYDNYVILGACNPPFAYEALTIEKEIGLLLPCNVIIFEENERVFVSAVLPTVAMNVADNTALAELAEKVEEKLKRAIDEV
ncbi:MAG: hypothetical protein A2283_09875 [Lentisphaerae bacterium RIFOXYA12_FULL_48_11]|nr:MAG: hypothetical protein A2259_01840 [Candidatus Moranbacteria bacterium RIFOXYA2_FULL_43_15]OGV69207.1 MAG: hypothetical protein A2283_09875 [Lentisphaerae bacterium RIFOXYA12_FULL_48_11]